MKAVILNSGEGKRMDELTDEKPKCMVKLNEETILARQLRLLSDFGVKDVIITTGPFEEKLRKHAEAVSDLNFEFVYNPEYGSTNYIYSLYLVDDIVGKENVLLLHGDLCFEREVLNKLVGDGNTGLINTDEDSPKKDFDAQVVDGLVKEIGVDLDYKDKVGFMPFYHLSNTDFAKWIRSIEEFVDEGELRVYAEDALNPLLESEEVRIKGVDFSDNFCMEIDTQKDLGRAKEILGDLDG